MIFLKITDWEIYFARCDIFMHNSKIFEQNIQNVVKKSFELLMNNFYFLWLIHCKLPKFV